MTLRVFFFYLSRKLSGQIKTIIPAAGGRGFCCEFNNMDIKALPGRVIGAAIKVHKALGPDLLESTYEECLHHELQSREIPFERHKDLPIECKGVKLDCGYRLDILVVNRLILELKACKSLEPIHETKLLACPCSTKLQ